MLSLLIINDFFQLTKIKSLPQKQIKKSSTICSNNSKKSEREWQYRNQEDLQTFQKMYIPFSYLNKSVLILDSRDNNFCDSSGE